MSVREKAPAARATRRNAPAATPDLNRARQTPLSFAWLLDPITPEEFFAEYYERRVLYVARQDRTRYEWLLSIATIDKVLTSQEHTLNDMFLVDATRQIEPEAYTFDGEAPRQIDVARLLQLYGQGASLSFSYLHEKVPELAALCRAVEHVFSARFQTNIYLTPPSAQGFKTHFDSHDVFVLQISGSKLWTFYDTTIELPMHGQKFEPERDIAGPATASLTLHAGDLLYCPRGLFHDARTTGETSLHITLGLIGKTWGDLLVEALSAACLQSPAFRANLPAGFANAGFNSAEATATFHRLIDEFARSAKLDPILDRFVERFVAEHRPDLSGCLVELDSPPAITIETRLRPRAHIVYQLHKDATQGNVTILFGSTRIVLPEFTHDAVAFALRGPEFVVGALPGAIDDEGKAVLARRLVREGLLERA